MREGSWKDIFGEDKPNPRASMNGRVGLRAKIYTEMYDSLQGVQSRKNLHRRVAELSWMRSMVLNNCTCDTHIRSRKVELSRDTVNVSTRLQPIY